MTGQTMTGLSVVIASTMLSVAARYAARFKAAIAIAGGLAVATQLTVFFVPALYAGWFRVARAVGPSPAAAPAPAA